ncbi:sterile alpha motif domain-containing protein 3-like [Paramisgurnus dabryanus]|uniref:sterile alpha motif domain-containing protein 3-like n=1 Tax=Paramisgurnus dabryanus TaxID=90735 RepID=UPI0031F4477D
MDSTAKLLVILGDNDCERLILPTGIPDSLNDLKREIQTQLGVHEHFRIQFKDPDFNDFVNLSSTSDIQDRATLKVIQLPSSTSSSSAPSVPEVIETSSGSSCDTDIISSSHSSAPSSSSHSSAHSTPESLCCVRNKVWPQSFPIPQFSFDAEMQLQKAQLAYQTDGTLLSPNTKLKSDILDALAAEIIKYKAYPSTADLDDVASALVQKFPCLKEKGSASGYYGWKISLKYKMANFRTKLRNIGCSELNINSHKRKGSVGSPNQVKKPKKAEVNYCPDYPLGETKETLEHQRIALLSEVTKRNNEQVIRGLMDRTFSLRRHEVVEDLPGIGEFKNRWPALFNEREVSAEFSRITTIPLVSKFMGQLDHFSTQLISVFRKKGGAAGQKINNIMSVLDQNVSIEKRRECILKALVVYVNEDPSNLVKEYMDVEHEEAQTLMRNTTLGIYVINPEGAHATDPYQDVGIIIEGIKILENLNNVAHACSMMLGLIYAFNLAYPQDLRYTFEIFQKLLMELDANKLSNKVHVLKNKLLF